MNKYLIFIFLLLILGTGSYVAFKTFNHKQAASLPKQIQEASTAVSVAKKASLEATQKVKNLPRIEEVVSVGSVLSSEGLDTLKEREITFTGSISALEVVVDKQDVQIKIENKLILQEKRQVVIYKVLTAVAVVVIVVLIL